MKSENSLPPSNEVEILVRPSLLPQILPPTIFMHYPVEINVPARQDAHVLQKFQQPASGALLAYKCYWERACIRTTLRTNGFKKKSKAWTVLWHKHCSDEQLSGLHAFQKVNHFSGSWCVGRKDRLARTLNLFRRLHGSAFDFHPESYILPHDREAFLRTAKADIESNASKSTTKKRPVSSRAGRQAAYDSMLWIAKPVASSCGRGISVVTTEQAVKLCNKKNKKVLLQRYLSKPYLIDDKKFDLRIYVLVTGVDPLRVYIYREGLTRISTSKFSLHDLENKFAHLTNFSINKKNDIFKAADYSAGGAGEGVGRDESGGGQGSFPAGFGVRVPPSRRTRSAEEDGDSGDDEPAPDEDGGDAPQDGEENDDAGETEGFKWSLSAFRKWLSQREGAAKADAVFQRIHDIVVKTFIAAESELTPLLSQSVRYKHNCFELFGCDVILDRYCCPHLLEVNVSPSLLGSSPLDLAIKGRLMSDVLHVVGVYPHDDVLIQHYSHTADGGGSKLGPHNTHNPLAFCNLNKLLSSQEEYRRRPAPESIDLAALARVDADVPLCGIPGALPVPPAASSSGSSSGGGGSGHCAWWQLMVLVEDEIRRAQSSLFVLAHPHLPEGPWSSSIPAPAPAPAASPSAVPDPPRVFPPHSAAHYLQLYRHPRFLDQLLFRWLRAGGALGAAGRHLPAPVRKLLGWRPPPTPTAEVALVAVRPVSASSVPRRERGGASIRRPVATSTSPRGHRPSAGEGDGLSAAAGPSVDDRMARRRREGTRSGSQTPTALRHGMHAPFHPVEVSAGPGEGLTQVLPTSSLVPLPALFPLLASPDATRWTGNRIRFLQYLQQLSQPQPQPQPQPLSPAQRHATHPLGTPSGGGGAGSTKARR